MRTARVAGTGNQGLAAEPTNDEPITVNSLGEGKYRIKEIGRLCGSGNDHYLDLVLVSLSALLTSPVILVAMLRNARRSVRFGGAASGAPG